MDAPMIQKITNALDIVAQDAEGNDTMKALLTRLAGVEPTREEIWALLLMSEFIYDDHVRLFAKGDPDQVEAASKASLGALLTFGILVGKQIGVEEGQAFGGQIDLSGFGEDS